MKLYFDIGNSDIKLNFNYEGKEFYVSYPTHSDHSVDSLYQTLPKEVTTSTIESAAIVSVVPKAQELVSGLVKKYFQIRPMISGYPLKSGVKLNTDSPKEVGSDLVALASLATTLGDNVTIVNLGTATTFINVKDKELKGVVISAGLGTQIDALVNKTSGLSEVVLTKTNKAIGRNTQEAMSIGLLHGHVEMIKALVARIDETSKVYISGGHARKIKDLVDYEFIKEATLEGLKNIEKINRR